MGGELPLFPLGWIGSPARSEPEYPEELPPPHVYPVAEGGVRLEWSIKPDEISLEIDLSQKSGEWHTLNLESDIEDSRTLNLDDVAAWDWMIRRLSEMVGARSRD